MVFKCPHGVKRTSKATGKRKCESTAYVGCPVGVNVNQQEDGTFLVTKAVLEHENHETGRGIYERYMVNKRLSKDQENAVKAFIDTDPSTVEVVLLLKDLTGRDYSTKNAFNIIKKLK